jgi:hypothetical protein
MARIQHPVPCVLEQALVSSNFLALIGNPRFVA